MCGDFSEGRKELGNVFEVRKKFKKCVNLGGWTGRERAFYLLR